MSKRVLIGLLAVSVVAMWGSDANAFNRINGMSFKHIKKRSVVAEVRLSGFEQDSLLTLEGRTDVEFICKKKGDPTVREKQRVNLNFNVTKQLASFDFNQTVVTLILDQISCVQCRRFKKVKDSERIVDFDATTTWKRCIGSGPDQSDDGNPCFEFNGTDEETTVTIEALRTFECDDPDVREEGGGIPDREVSCTTEQVGPDGIPPAPPPESCGNGVVESGEQCDGENLNGQTCATQGFNDGELACSTECTFDTSGCSLSGSTTLNRGE